MSYHYESQLDPGRVNSGAPGTQPPWIALGYVDDHSRLAYSEILADEKGATWAGFIVRAADYFAHQGISRIERVITDNHLSYRRSTEVANVIATIGAKHLFIKPHCPWQNGKVERFNRTLQVEWSYRRVFASQRRPRPRACTLDGVLNAATAHSTAYHPSADCDQRSDRVQLALNARGIDTAGDLREVAQDTKRLARVEGVWRDVSGQRSGITWHYLLMLAGIPGVKPDRMICAS